MGDWLRDCDDARLLADDITAAVQSRREAQAQRVDATANKLAAAIRRKLGSLGIRVSALEAALAEADCTGRELDRRRALVAQLSEAGRLASEALGAKDVWCVALWRLALGVWALQPLG